MLHPCSILEATGKDGMIIRREKLNKQKHYTHQCLCTTKYAQRTSWSFLTRDFQISKSEGGFLWPQLAIQVKFLYAS